MPRVLEGLEEHVGLPVSKEPTDASRIRSDSRGDAGSYPPSPRGSLDTRVERQCGRAQSTFTGARAEKRWVSVSSIGLGSRQQVPLPRSEPGDLATLCDSRAVETFSCLESPSSQNKSFLQRPSFAPRVVLSNPGSSRAVSVPLDSLYGKETDLRIHYDVQGEGHSVLQVIIMFFLLSLAGSSSSPLRAPWRELLDPGRC
jgi:hypothetical protein